MHFSKCMPALSTAVNNERGQRRMRTFTVVDSTCSIVIVVYLHPHSPNKLSGHKYAPTFSYAVANNAIATSGVTVGLHPGKIRRPGSVFHMYAVSRILSAFGGKETCGKKERDRKPLGTVRVVFNADRLPPADRFFLTAFRTVRRSIKFCGIFPPFTSFDKDVRACRVAIHSRICQN